MIDIESETSVISLTEVSTKVYIRKCKTPTYVVKFHSADDIFDLKDEIDTRTPDNET